MFDCDGNTFEPVKCSSFFIYPQDIYMLQVCLCYAILRIYLVYDISSGYVIYLRIMLHLGYSEFDIY